ncbi:MAG: imidazole glycerol phosphate synthase subunit HisF [Melioribacteraceae bacterium]|nr:imidazole glycerol phosphate synthase subunit HisF [Melioribacteraceae bacterium]MCF8354295.1 imidazole glycerol phosphate synthase subunit HisF [Melioribacteraceae bacterium]MCF8394573.1 imidazole glycerol phosphate synthase subunit HisF [Melioribacteraceae bacterium]MCF8419758.1 imidazole glycerol phosphate synthase subunit HisF [Melioribacteraceae bacterium]
MLAKRIIPCLDVKDGRVVKGINFINLKDAGSAIELAERYSDEGADELVFLDITATQEKRNILIDLVKQVAKVIRIPFTVGGGIKSSDEIDEILKAGADKVSLNSSIVKTPGLIDEASKRFGSQAIVAAIDVKKSGDNYKVYVEGGRKETSLDGLSWCIEVCERGAGEILLTWMDKDGTRSGYDLEFLKKLGEEVTIPIIASGGAGNMMHFYEAFHKAETDACLAAGLFHYGEMKIGDLKSFLINKGIEIRL